MTDTLPDGSLEVLIAGAGAVGLTIAVSLGQRGIRCLLAERMAGSSVDWAYAVGSPGPEFVTSMVIVLVASR